jgi:hypothetical protein
MDKLAILAVALVPIPFILDEYGKPLSLRSPWAKEFMEDKVRAIGIDKTRSRSAS